MSLIDHSLGLKMSMFIPKCLFPFSFSRQCTVNFFSNLFFYLKKTGFIIWKYISCHKTRLILREQCSHIDQYQSQNAGFRVEKDEIVRTTVINWKEPRKQLPSFHMRSNLLGSVPRDWDPYRQESRFIESRVLIIINHGFTYPMWQLQP
jgi:hypothetical protein